MAAIRCAGAIHWLRPGKHHSALSPCMSPPSEPTSDSSDSDSDLSATSRLTRFGLLTALAGDLRLPFFVGVGEPASASDSEAPSAFSSALVGRLDKNDLIGQASFCDLVGEAEAEQFLHSRPCLTSIACRGYLRGPGIYCSLSEKQRVVAKKPTRTSKCWKLVSLSAFIGTQPKAFVMRNT